MSVLLPYACVETFLNSHPLIRISKSSSRVIYNIIIDILTRLHAETNTTTLTREVFACESCGHVKYSIDVKESEIVCDRCGLCTKWTNPDNCTVFGHEYVRERENVELEDEIYHWMHYKNALVPRGVDDVHNAIMYAKHTSKGNLSTRAIASLIIPQIMERIDVRRLQKESHNLDKLEIASMLTKGRPKFTCAKCGMLVHNEWETRRHACRWGQSHTSKKRKH